MSGPRAKRPLAGAASDPSQRQIPDFFSRSSTADDHHSPSPPAPSATPSLPAGVQSNLLLVGMRVRKSVPEGYKTGSEPTAFSLWTDTTAMPAPTTMLPTPQSSSSSSSICDADGLIHPPITSIHRSGSTNIVSSRRELLPFCGLHKVGGLSTQDLPPYPVEFAESRPFDEVPPPPPPPGLASSQASAASSSSSAMAAAAPSATNRKRLHLDDAAVARPVPWRDAWLDGEVSPRTTAPLALDGAAGRILAVPRGARKSAAAAQGKGRLGEGGVLDVGMLGQENVVVVEADGDKDIAAAAGAPLACE